MALLKSHRFVRLMGLLTLCGIGLGLAFFWPKEMHTPEDINHYNASIEQGRYLATAGNCATCHTSTDGPAYAGGLAFQTPFGVLYSTNITMDKKTGIGSWSFKDFYQSMKELLDYVKDANPNINHNSVINLRDEAGKAAKADASVFKGVWIEIRNVIKGVFESLYQGNFENLDNKETYEREFQKHYTDYGYNKASELKGSFKKKTNLELLNMAKEKNIVLPPNFNILLIGAKNKLVNALVKKTIKS